MKTIEKRILLFLFGCLIVRSLLVILAKQINIKYLPWLGILALIPAIGFFTIYIRKSRLTGPEVFGEKIWWNSLRPIHGLLYLLFAWFAIQKQSFAWIFLLIDVIIGFTVFLLHHMYNIMYT